MRLADSEVQARIDRFVADPAGSAICVDFDGTLSDVVAVPDDAVAVPGALSLLAELHATYPNVAVISGRPLAFLDDRLPGTFTKSGLYGLEESVEGERRTNAEADRWQPVVAEATERASAEAPAGTRVEGKGLSLTVHYREHPEIRQDLEAWTQGVAAASGLVVRPARMSFELHPPINLDKGTVVRNFAAGCRQVLYVGDDVGDVAAFEALDALALRKLTTLKVVVAGHETPAEVVALGDVVVDGPQQVIALLRGLLP